MFSIASARRARPEIMIFELIFFTGGFIIYYPTAETTLPKLPLRIANKDSMFAKGTHKESVCFRTGRFSKIPGLRTKR